MNNELIGLILYPNSSFNKISGNLIENNRWGIELSGFLMFGHTYKNTIFRNTIANNTDSGIDFWPGPNLNNQIIANNFRTVVFVPLFVIPGIGRDLPLHI